jgi:hypothetical protein
LLVPYVKACPACADALFSVIANRTIEELHQEARETPTTARAGGSRRDHRQQHSISRDLAYLFP